MAKVVIPRSELPIPVSDNNNKFRFRVVNENRNIFSDWSVINYVHQEELDRNSTRGLPSTNPNAPGDLLSVISIDSVDNWDIGWVPVAAWIDQNNIVTYDFNHDLPPGGLTGQVLFKLSDADYIVDWGYLVPPNGEPGQVVVKKSTADFDVDWGYIPDPGTNNPQIVNLCIGISFFA